MNNYQNYYSDYYNYDNNNYNAPVYNQKKTVNLYDPYSGFIRGNMFPDLYNTYKLKAPIEITPMNEQADMLTYIDALAFATIDLNLYLDVHPDDKEMIELFNQYRRQLCQYKEEYQKKFGPLLISSDSLNTFPWKWNDSPWPWENNKGVGV